MDLANSAFQNPSPTSRVSRDVMSHTNMVMACRFGWSSALDSSSARAQTPNASTSTKPTSSFNNVRTKRFAPCQGRLYHQLLCSHRIRTDLVEDCGPNCIEPYGDMIDAAFVCNECIQAETSRIWESQEANHNAQYPSMDQMTKEQYDRWYTEHRQLETTFSRNHRIYMKELHEKMRPSNICSALEASKEEMEFATELDSLSLSTMMSNDESSRSDHCQSHNRSRTSLPNDASEQLHWNLSTLDLDRGACSVEYSASQAKPSISTVQSLDPRLLWIKPRDRS